METKINLDWNEVQSLMLMLKKGAEHHRRLAIDERNTVDAIEQIMHADTFDKLLETISIKVKKSERKQTYSLNIKLSTAESYSIIKGILPPMNSSYNDMVKYKLTDAIAHSSHEAIAFYSSLISIQQQQQLLR